MSYRVRIESFEGPFDLLLYLVSRQKVDIGSISIIVDQYVAYIDRMQKLDLEVASDFLLVASTLLDIKAASLIPSEKTEVEDELEELSPNEAREILIEKLIAYKQYKNAAWALKNRFELEGRMHPRLCGPDQEFLGIMPDYLESTTLDSLAFLCAEVMARREVFLLESEHIAAKPIPVETHVRAIHRRISTRKRMMFSELLEAAPTLQLRVVNFLAILELYKRGMDILTAKETKYGAQTMRELERICLLRNVDSKWMEHIDNMDQLKQGMGLRGYGQHDPVVEYRIEGFAMFDEMIASIREDAVHMLLTIEIRQQNAQPKREQIAKPTGEGAPAKAGAKGAAPVRVTKIGRNDPCPCGSGLKWKKCTCEQYHHGKE